MKIQSPRRIRTEDFSAEQREMIEKLGVALNSNIDTLYQLVNKRISPKDNMATTVATFTVTVNASGTPTNTVFVNQDKELQNEVVIGVQPIDAVATDGTSMPEAGIFINWESNKTGININKIKGLPPNKEFTITLIIYT